MLGSVASHRTVTCVRPTRGRHLSGGSATPASAPPVCTAVLPTSMITPDCGCNCMSTTCSVPWPVVRSSPTSSLAGKRRHGCCCSCTGCQDLHVIGAQHSARQLRTRPAGLLVPGQQGVLRQSCLSVSRSFVVMSVSTTVGNSSSKTLCAALATCKQKQCASGELLQDTTGCALGSPVCWQAVHELRCCHTSCIRGTTLMMLGAAC